MIAKTALLVFLAVPAFSTEVPYYLQTLKDESDVGAINDNFRATADAVRKEDLTAGGTITGTLTFSGAGSGIIWGDGRTSTTTASSSSVIVTTFSYPNGTFTQSSLISCLANSTATVTTGNNRVLINFAGAVSLNSDGVWVYASVLIDGAHMAGYGPSTPINAITLSGGGLNPQANLSFSILSDVLSAASHTFCMVFATNAGNTIVLPSAQGLTTRAKMSIVELNTGNK